MKLKIQIGAMMIFLAATLGCSKDSSNSSASTAASTLTLALSSSTVAPGGSATVTVSGGSGSYTTASASEGILNLTSPNTYTFTAPSSATNPTVTLTISDSLGATGSANIYVSSDSGGVTGVGSNSSSTSSSTSCEGTYDANIAGVSATLYVVQGSSNYIGGLIYMFNFYYPIIGTCSLSNGSGSISFTNVVDSSPYSGTITLSGSQLSISGTMTSSGGTGYSWTASSQTAAATFTSPIYSCQGNYNATIGSNSGQITIVQDGNGNVAGYLYLQGYVYALVGTCSANGGSVSMVNYTTGSTYTGTATYSSSKVNMSGTFTTTGGVAYSWSASQQ